MKRAFVKTLLPVLLIPLLFTSCGKKAGTDDKQPVATNQIPTNQTVASTPQKNVARPIEFPKDEGAHVEQPIEWWYVNSQLVDANGKEYGFFFCILNTGRHLVSLYDKSANKVITKDYYESTKTTPNSFLVSSPSLKWQQDGAPFRSRISYTYEGITFDLTIKSNRKPFLPGGNGFISMGEKGTSHYYALTDLTLDGTLNMGTNPVAVKGTGWFDHQWGSWDWIQDFSQWKWYAVKLDNGVDLMLFNIYKDKKIIDSYCGYMDAKGDQFHNLQCELVTKEYYKDAQGGNWQKVVELKIPSLKNTVLTLTSENDLQFVEANILWEGSMKAAGTFNGVPVKGMAYGELNRPD